MLQYHYCFQPKQSIIRINPLMLCSCTVDQVFNIGSSLTILNCGISPLKFLSFKFLFKGYRFKKVKIGSLTCGNSLLNLLLRPPRVETLFSIEFEIGRNI